MTRPIHRWQAWGPAYLPGAPVEPPPPPGPAPVVPPDIAPPPANLYFPFSFTDPVFTGMTSFTDTATLPDGAVSDHESYVESSGEPTLLCEGSATLRYVRVASRECVRLVKGAVSFDWCYLESAGLDSEEDHADTIQVYSPGDVGTWTLRNTTVRAHNEAATAGFFIADEHESHVICHTVLFWGGPFGFRIHHEGKPCTVDFQNVFFVRDSFGYAPCMVDAPITRWDNVYLCDLVDGGVTNLSPLEPA